MDDPSNKLITAFFSSRSLIAAPATKLARVTYDQFHPFRRLPTDIRIMIWHFSLEPRVVDLQFEGKASRKVFYSHDKIPTLLEVCRDSRAAVIASYPLCFGSVWYPQKIRFNFSMNTLFMDGRFLPFVDRFFIILTPVEFASIQRMAIPRKWLGSGQWVSLRSFHEDFTASLNSMSGLKELLCVSNISHLRMNSQSNGDYATDRQGGTWAFKTSHGQMYFLHRVPSALIVSTFFSKVNWMKKIIVIWRFPKWFLWWDGEGDVCTGGGTEL